MAIDGMTKKNESQGVERGVVWFDAAELKLSCYWQLVKRRHRSVGSSRSLYSCRLRHLRGNLYSDSDHSPDTLFLSFPSLVLLISISKFPCLPKPPRGDPAILEPGCLVEVANGLVDDSLRTIARKLEDVGPRYLVLDSGRWLDC